MKNLEFLYHFIEDYAKSKSLSNTLLALPLAQELLGDMPRRTFKTDAGTLTCLEHCLCSTKMLIDLHTMLPSEEEDLLLASTLCLDFPKKVAFSENGQELIDTYHLDSRILEVIQTVARPDAMSEEEKAQYYQKIHDNKLAVLVALAERSNLVEQLSELSISDVNEFVHEMRTHCLPMCVNAKQHCRDCHMSINIMMEKIRCLIDVTDIIANRYQKREMAYTNEILSIMEENARLRGMIHQLEIGEIADSDCFFK